MNITSTQKLLKKEKILKLKQKEFRKQLRKEYNQERRKRRAKEFLTRNLILLCKTSCKKHDETYTNQTLHADKLKSGKYCMIGKVSDSTFQDICSSKIYNIKDGKLKISKEITLVPASIQNYWDSQVFFDKNSTTILSNVPQIYLASTKPIKNQLEKQKINIDNIKVLLKDRASKREVKTCVETLNKLIKFYFNCEEKRIQQDEVFSHKNKFEKTKFKA